MKKILTGIILLIMLTMVTCAPSKHALLNYKNEFWFNENIPFMIRTGEAMDLNEDGKMDTAVCYYSFQGYTSPDVIAYFEIIGEEFKGRVTDYATKPRAFMVGLDHDLDGKVDRIYTDTNGDGRLDKEKRYNNNNKE